MSSLVEKVNRYWCGAKGCQGIIPTVCRSTPPVSVTSTSGESQRPHPTSKPKTGRAAVVFRVPGIPQPQPRPLGGRFVKRNYPKGFKSWREQFTIAARVAWGSEVDGPIGVHIEAVYPMKGKPLKRGSRPEIWKATRPDLDNVIKAVLDGLPWDDGCVAEISARKYHGAQGSEPYTEVTLWQLHARE